MWEQMKKVSRRQSSRKSVAYVLSAFIAVFLWMFTLPNVANAAEAAWNNNSILYSGHQYIGPVVTKENEIPELAKDTTYYTYAETITERPLTQKAHIIYFSTGVDPGNATTASYAEYILNGRVFSSPSEPTAITIAPKGTSSSNESSCSVSGIGWVICPVSTFLASGMDWIFSVLRTFIEVQPVNVTNPNSDLFAAWNVMRNISNIVFTIVFLIIIYSQITSLGISNYGIKKMLPRLIVAALLVNLSYYICAVAIDISNILGYAMQDMFMNIRNSVFHITNDTLSPDVTSWESITGAILSGGAVGALIGGGALGLMGESGGAITGMLVLQLPVLLALLLVVLVALLILAARQALIVILVIIAPLAFVANLLPNTEKWFEKWKDTFMTMLIFFPAISVVFGGSQLASAVIIQNASSILMLVLGMIVQVAPLMITPLLLKFSGGLIGKIAGIVNDPKKGVLDRTRNWSKNRAEAIKYKKISGPIKSSDFLGRTGRYMEYKSRQDPRKTEYYKQRFGNYETNRRQTNPYDQQLEIDTALEKMQNKEYEERFALGIDELRAGRSDTLDNLRTQGKLGQADQIKNRYNVKRGHDTINTISQKAVSRAVDLDYSTRITESARASAQLIQKQNYAEAMRENTAMQRLAGGIDDVNGSNRALAGAIAAIDKAQKDARANIKVIMAQLNTTRDQLQAIATGTSDLISSTAETRAAALEMIFGSKDDGAIAQAYEQIDFSFPDVSAEDRKMLQMLVSDSMMAGSRAPWVGGGTTSMLRQGIGWDKERIEHAYGVDGVDESIIAAINGGKIKAEKIATMGTDYLKQLIRATSSKKHKIDAVQLDKLRENIEYALDPKRDLYSKLGDSEEKLEELRDIVK